MPVGVAAAGFIDADQSNVLYAPNLSWRDEPLRERLEEKIQRSLVIENDANAAGWAEYRFGAGRGSKDMVMLTLGTGVGGAVISDGAIRRGGFGIAGELGHIRVVRGGKQCGCGRTGCVEAVCLWNRIARGGESFECQRRTSWKLSYRIEKRPQ